MLKIAVFSPLLSHKMLASWPDRDFLLGKKKNNKKKPRHTRIRDTIQS